MRFFSRLSQLSLVICFFSALHAQQQDQKFWVVARGGLNLRGEPSLTGKKVTTIPEGEQVAYLAAAGSITVGKVIGYWWKVSWQDKTGYAFSGFLSGAKPMAVALDKPLQGQFTAACLSSSGTTPPKSCAGQCEEGSFLLNADTSFAFVDGMGCESGGFPYAGNWSLSGNTILLAIDDEKSKKKHQVILQLNKKGEAVVKKVSKGLKGWKVGHNYGRLYEQ